MNNFDQQLQLSGYDHCQLDGFFSSIGKTIKSVVKPVQKRVTDFVKQPQNFSKHLNNGDEAFRKITGKFLPKELDGVAEQVKTAIADSYTFGGYSAAQGVNQAYMAKKMQDEAAKLSSAMVAEQMVKASPIADQQKNGFFSALNGALTSNTAKDLYNFAGGLLGDYVSSRITPQQQTQFNAAVARLQGSGMNDSRILQQVVNSDFFQNFAASTAAPAATVVGLAAGVDPQTAVTNGVSAAAKETEFLAQKVGGLKVRDWLFLSPLLLILLRKK